MNAILEANITLPAYVSKDAADLVLKLVEKDVSFLFVFVQPKKRIACGEEGADEIKRHPWFKNINWESLA